MVFGLWGKRWGGGYWLYCISVKKSNSSWFPFAQVNGAVVVTAVIPLAEVCALKETLPEFSVDPGSLTVPIHVPLPPVNAEWPAYGNLLATGRETTFTPVGNEIAKSVAPVGAPVKFKVPCMNKVFPCTL